MNLQNNEIQDEASPSYLPQYDVLRHRGPKTPDFSELPLSNEMQERLAQLTNQQIADHKEKLTRENRIPSEREVEEIQNYVAAQYRDAVYKCNIRLALWKESERILKLLRTRGLGPVRGDVTFNQQKTEYILKLDLNLFPEANPQSLLYLGADSSVEQSLPSSNSSQVRLLPTAINPNGYFELTCPVLVADFGYPFHISMQQKLVGINTDFFGAYLAGEKRFMHDVVFYVPESRFYFFDPMASQYIPTTEDKIRIWLSLILQERAWGYYMDHATTILTQFRTHAVMDEIIVKAKSLLAAEREFFEGSESHPRFVAEDSRMLNLQFTVRLFTERTIRMEEKGILTITDFMDGLKNFLQENGTSLPKHLELKHIAQETIRQIHGKGLRNDLVLPDNKSVAGWKGLRLCVGDANPVDEKQEIDQNKESGISNFHDEVEAVPPDTISEPEAAKIRQSGLSEVSALSPIIQTSPVALPEVALLN